MSTYEVLNVTSMEPAAELRGFEIETPQTGGEGDVYVLSIGGWVAARETRPVAIEVVYHDRVLRTSPIKGIHLDVAARYPEMPVVLGGGFHALIGLLGLKLESELFVRAVLEDETRVPLGSIAIRRRPIRTAFDPTIQPLMLTSLGRTGTTLLMKALTTHPEILVFRRFPYEYSAANYWVHMLRVLSEPANLVESAHPDNFHGNLHWVGHNPFHDESVYERPALGAWIGRTYVEELAAFCQKSIEDWYTTMAHTQAQDTPSYFAEKMWPGFSAVLTWELYPKAKEVILVRDFRDVACSMLAFDARRNYSNFGRPDGKSDEEYIREEVRGYALQMQNSWRSRRDRAHLVRYEDIILRPVETLTDLLDYLELDRPPQLVDQMLSQATEDLPELPGASTDPYLVEIHRTIPDPKRRSVAGGGKATALATPCTGTHSATCWRSSATRSRVTPTEAHLPPMPSARGYNRRRAA